MHVVCTSSSPPLHGEGGKRLAEMNNDASLVEETFYLKPNSFNLGSRKRKWVDKQATNMERMGESGLSEALVWRAQIPTDTQKSVVSPVTEFGFIRFTTEYYLCKFPKSMKCSWSAWHSGAEVSAQVRTCWPPEATGYLATGAFPNLKQSPVAYLCWFDIKMNSELELNRHLLCCS